MTTITKERLLTIKQWRETYGPGSNVVLPAEEAEELARIALASLEAEPVAYIIQDSDARSRGEKGILRYFANISDEDINEYEITVTPLYAAPPETVSVPDAMEMDDDFDSAFEHGKAVGWNAYRAAMFQSGNFRENKNSSTNNFREIAETSTNYPVIPSEVLSAIQKVAKIRADFDDFDGDRRGIGDCLDEAEQELIVTINKYASQLAAEPIATNDVREQTAVPPVPVIQADVAQAIEKLKRKLVECNRYNYCADAVKGVEYACHAAMLQGSQPVSNHEELPLDYLQGQKDGLEWAAQLAEANHPQTGDWLYDDPLELAKAIRKGPDMPEFDGPTPVTPDGWISCSERMPEETGDIIVVSDGIVMSGISYSRRDGFYIAALEYDDDEPIGGVTHWMPLPEPPQEVNRG
ncbi:DUF551 domain-containing protein [Salmonella enterica]|uniref:DUF551 domain-containing protein n=3 Tax=Enterobacteriaceae TaxID=543 RepID=A0A3K8YQT9_SALER|nr:DUF551 domain-containing protein [Salmonella enterica]MHI23909.1 DUF551 domain-containing protein [Salmonella enterica]